MLYLTKNNKSPYYQVIYFVDGKRTTLTTKKKTKSEALEFVTRFKEELQNRELEIDKITLQDFYQKYLEYCESSKSKKYIKSIKLSFQLFIREISSDILLEKISPKLIDEFITKKSITAKRGINVYLRTLKAAFSKAENWDYLRENPFKKIKLLKVPINNDSIVSKTDLKKIINVTENKVIANIFEFAFYTGLRLSEIINLKKKSIDFENRIISVENDKNFELKSKRSRIVPMAERVYEILLSRIDKDEFDAEDYIFGKQPFVKYSDSWISHKFKKSVIAVELSNELHFHSLRHSFCSSLARENISLSLIMKLAGHADYSTCLRYSHFQNSELSKAIEIFNNDD